jgi:RNA polymerase sigma-70 factor (ECF subfamily)
MTQPAATEEFARLFAENRDRIFRYIRSLVPHRTDAEDVFQDSAVVLWREFEKFRPGAPFLPWALAIAFNQVRTHRHRRRQARLFFGEGLLEKLAAESEKLGDELERRSQALLRCCERLPPADRDLVAIYYTRDSTVGAIAEELGRPANTIYKALQRIRHALRSCIERRLAAEAL